MTSTRRAWLSEVLIGGAVIGLAPTIGCNRPQGEVLAGSSDATWKEIEAAAGARIGLAAVDLATGTSLEHRGNQRFALCSTFKLPLAGLILRSVEQGRVSLDQRLPVEERALVSYSPVTKARAGGSMNVEDLIAAMLTYSDNTAANLLLAELGGPEVFTSQVRSLGDSVTRLDRMEPELNENRPGDARDTTTPLAMLQLMRTFLFGDALGTRSQERLRAWMIGCKTGAKRLRAGLPATWQVGNRSGSSANDQSNDIAFALPAADARGSRGPLLIASYLSIPDPMGAEANEVHARLGRTVVSHWGEAPSQTAQPR